MCLSRLLALGVMSHMTLVGLDESSAADASLSIEESIRLQVNLTGVSSNLAVGPLPLTVAIPSGGNCIASGDVTVANVAGALTVTLSGGVESVIGLGCELRYSLGDLRGGVRPLVRLEVPRSAFPVVPVLFSLSLEPSIQPTGFEIVELGNDQVGESAVADGLWQMAAVVHEFGPQASPNPGVPSVLSGTRSSDLRDFLPGDELNLPTRFSARYRVGPGQMISWNHTFVWSATALAPGQGRFGLARGRSNAR